MTHSLIKTALGAMVLLSAMACTTNYYDEEKYEEYIKYNSPVDSVDQYHQWRLTEERSYKITANVNQDVEKVMLLTANPLSSTNAEVMNESVIAKGESKWMMVSVPMIQSTLYVALVDKDGIYYVKSFPVTQTEVNFSGGINTGTPIGTLKPQTYSYIYEKDFPLVGDYDYNDLVFRIGVEHTTPKQVVVHVTLSAVGCNEQLAGFFRVMGCKFDDIDSVTTANGKTFNDNLPAGSKNFVRSYDLLICSTKNQPVITVCADAHWAMDPYQSIMENTGAIALRKYYNTSLDASPEYESRNSVSQSYIIYFKDSTIAENITLEEIDPFIVKNYNSGVYEVHLDELKASQVLYNYQVEFRIKDLPWALLIPSDDFKYPLEGVQIGFYKRTDTGVVFSDGAYKTTGHAFGAWVENHKAALDWYNYPDESQVWIF
jgi:LruC domain-containing protein